MMRAEHIIAAIRRHGLLGTIRISCTRLAAMARGGGLHTADREVLEGTIIPHWAAEPDIRRVLFVGCDWYTSHYHEAFARAEYWTIDCDPHKARHATKNHVICTLQDAVRHFEPGWFDLIVCNGVYGWGLDAKKDIEAGFTACHTLLRPGGDFILGWNDVPEHRPVPLEQIQSLKLFQPRVFPPLQTERYRTDTPMRHTFDFYVKG